MEDFLKKFDHRITLKIETTVGGKDDFPSTVTRLDSRP